MSCFNPYRVFSIVATPEAPPRIAGGSGSFNPYRVFSIVATIPRSPLQRTAGRVSIPIGFSLSLRRSRPVPRSRPDRPFQSLSGFLYRCDRLPLPAQGGVPGFNPYRVFSIVATEWEASFEDLYLRFQSLSGFLYRCDYFTWDWDDSTAAGFQSLSGFLYRCDAVHTDV